MMGLLRLAPRLPSRGLRLPHHVVVPGARKLQAGPRTPIGMVDFVGFADIHVPKGPSPDDTERIQGIVREREARNRKLQLEILRHPSLQPQITASLELPELASVLLSEVRDGTPSLSGSIEYSENAQGETLTLSEPDIYIMHKPAHWSEGARYPKTLVDEGESELRAATEAELNQVVCTSSSMKLSTSRFDLAPAGNAVLARAHTLLARSSLACESLMLAAPPSLVLGRSLPGATARRLLVARFLVGVGGLRAAPPPCGDRALRRPLSPGVHGRRRPDRRRYGCGLRRLGLMNMITESEDTMVQYSNLCEHDVEVYAVSWPAAPQEESSSRSLDI